jgi:hypothetical protein
MKRPTAVALCPALAARMGPATGSGRAGRYKVIETANIDRVFKETSSATHVLDVGGGYAYGNRHLRHPGL